jgi:dienelactone hydrolase
MRIPGYTRRLAVAVISPVLLLAQAAAAQVESTPLDVPVPDGTVLKATYYSPGKPGPGVLLLHQCNMNRKAWVGLGAAMANAGLHVLAVDYRGYGTSPKATGNYDRSGDIDASFAALRARTGVDPGRLAAGGASCGVENAVQVARRSGQIKALVLLSGPTSKEGIAYLKQHPSIAIFGAASSEEGMAVNSLKEVVATSTNPASRFRELIDAGHGAAMFAVDSTLVPAITAWTAGVLR